MEAVMNKDMKEIPDWDWTKIIGYVSSAKILPYIASAGTWAMILGGGIIYVGVLRNNFIVLAWGEFAGAGAVIGIIFAYILRKNKVMPYYVSTVTWAMILGVSSFFISDEFYHLKAFDVVHGVAIGAYLGLILAFILHKNKVMTYYASAILWANIIGGGAFFIGSGYYRYYLLKEIDGVSVAFSLNMFWITYHKAVLGATVLGAVFGLIFTFVQQKRKGKK